MPCDISKPESTPATFTLEALLHQLARYIVRSECPEVTRHQILVRLKEIIAADMAVAFKARMAAPDWSHRVAA